MKMDTVEPHSLKRRLSINSVDYVPIKKTIKTESLLKNRDLCSLDIQQRYVIESFQRPLRLNLQLRSKVVVMFVSVTVRCLGCCLHFGMSHNKTRKRRSLVSSTFELHGTKLCTPTFFFPGNHGHPVITFAFFLFNDN